MLMAPGPSPPRGPAPAGGTPPDRTSRSSRVRAGRAFATAGGRGRPRTRGTARMPLSPAPSCAPARHGRARRRRGSAHRNGVTRIDDAAGETPRLVQVADRECGLGGQDAVTRRQRRVRVLRQDLLRRREVSAGLGPPGGLDRGLGEPQVDGRFGGRGERRRGQHVRAERHAFVCAAGQRQRLHEQLLYHAAEGWVGSEGLRSRQRVDRRRQGPRLQRFPAGVHQEPCRPVQIACLLRKVRSHSSPDIRKTRVGRLDCRERPPRQTGTHVGEDLVEDGLARQRVPEKVGAAGMGQQEMVHRHASARKRSSAGPASVASREAATRNAGPARPPPRSPAVPRPPDVPTGRPRRPRTSPGCPGLREVPRRGREPRRQPRGSGRPRRCGPRASRLEPSPSPRRAPAERASGGARSCGPSAPAAARRRPKPGSDRTVTTQSTRSSRRLSARYSRTLSVSASAHCRSSRPTTNGAASARARSSRSTPSPRSRSRPPDRSTRGRGTLLAERQHRASNRGSEQVDPAPGAESIPRVTCSNASARGRKAVADPGCSERPSPTTFPWLRAACRTSRSRRDLPIPAPPASTTTPPRPCSASASAVRRAANSASRPTTTGHSSGTGRAATETSCSEKLVPRPPCSRRCSDADAHG